MAINPHSPSWELIKTALPDVKLIRHPIFGDERGFFYESYNSRVLGAYLGEHLSFVQDNHSRSAKDVLRGLHYQIENPQGKLVRVTYGAVFDVAVDLRSSSLTFGKWVGVILDDVQRLSLWIPSGFAHGFLVLTPYAEFQYKTTDYYNPQSERSIRWDDPTLAISWPLEGRSPQLSAKDRLGTSFSEAELFP